MSVGFTGAHRGLPQRAVGDCCHLRARDEVSVCPASAVLCVREWGKFWLGYDNAYVWVGGHDQGGGADGREWSAFGSGIGNN